MWILLGNEIAVLDELFADLALVNGTRSEYVRERKIC